MNSRRNSPTLLAFTLIELLTVITIIAILMGLLFPAINIVKEQARKAEAKAAVVQVAAAVKHYFTEYGKYPVGDPNKAPTDADLTYGEAARSNSELFDILRNVGSGGKPNEYNPRAIVFFEGKGATSEPPKGGFATTGDKKGAYIDPWGKEYRIVIDANYDNLLTTIPHTDFASPNEPRTGVGVFSLGKDGEIGSPKDGLSSKYKQGSKTSDDIITWQ